jgi:alpha-glucuronidase
MKKLFSSLFFLYLSLYLKAQDSHDLWLQDKISLPVTVLSSKKSPTLDIAIRELKQRWQGVPGATIRLTVKNVNAIKGDGFKLTAKAIEANTEKGILYGAYELLRRQQDREPIRDIIENPSYEIRVLDHWDNPDGSVERGYAGNSIFWRKDNPFVVTDNDKKLWQEYARANASIAINGSVLNNVNASPSILTSGYLQRVKEIADVLRPYGLKTYLSVKFSSPIILGKLKTADPMDPEVIVWWREKVKEIYNIIPDFGGFLIKASSEGQPGPQDYGRSHAEGANMLADALRPYNGIVMWRAFVYSANDKDRAKQAYNEFVPLDGKFKDNVIIQVKNGPVDFQPREPFSPLFGAMKRTSVMPEFQVTQEYLGHSIHLVFLSTMWEECLQSDTYQQGKGSTVARCTDGSIYLQKHTAISGVANIGLDSNWCGHDFAQANWYAFGRLAWNDHLKSEQLAGEWIKLTFYHDSAVILNSSNYKAEWMNHFYSPVKEMMLESREAAVNYMMPLGLHHIMSANGHYGPGPWWAPKRMRADWTPPYYHQASVDGIGFDRTSKGSDAVSQYHEPLQSQFNNPSACPDKFLLWFHHLPWTYRMKSGHTLWEELCYHYDKGVKQVREFQVIWDKAEPYIDKDRFISVQRKLREQSINAVLWKDACLQYFQQFSHFPIPYNIERPVNNLDEIITNDMRPKR